MVDIIGLFIYRLKRHYGVFLPSTLNPDPADSVIEPPAVLISIDVICAEVLTHSNPPHSMTGAVPAAPEDVCPHTAPTLDVAELFVIKTIALLCKVTAVAKSLANAWLTFCALVRVTDAVAAEIYLDQ
jgi:hypothetical protein